KSSLLNAYKNSDVRLVYSNTITNGDLLEQLSLLKCKFITHVHELENYIHICGEDNLNKVKKHTNFYIAPSHAVKDNLVLNHGIADSKITVVYEFLGEGILGHLNVSRSKAQVLDELSIPQGSFVVGACGTADWRKSPDLFVQLAGCAKRKYPSAPLYF